MYSCLLLILRAKIIEKFQREFKPKFFLSDYESGFIAAVKQYAPESKHIGCYFHFTQCIYRKIQNLGLTSAYKKKSERCFTL